MEPGYVQSTATHSDQSRLPSHDRLLNRAFEDAFPRICCALIIIGQCMAVDTGGDVHVSMSESGRDGGQGNAMAQ